MTQELLFLFLPKILKGQFDQTICSISFFADFLVHAVYLDGNHHGQIGE
jgi:hypothetical protein